MSVCPSPGISGVVVARSVPTIVAGSDVFLVVQTVVYRTNVASPFTDFQGASGYFPAASGGFFAVEGSLEDAARGQMRFDIPAELSEGLQAGDAQPFQVNFLDDGELLKIIISDQLNVAAPLQS